MPITTTNTAIHMAQRILESCQDDALVSANVAPTSPWERQNRQRSQAITQLWRKIGRQVLAIHPEVVEEVRLATSDKVPTEILRSLPYMNPMVVYPEPPVFNSWRGIGTEKTRLLGFFTCGVKNFLNGEALPDNPTEKGVVLPGNEQRLYSTTNTEANRFGILTVMEILDEHDRPIDIEFNTLTLHFGGEETLAETVDGLCARFHWYLPADSDERARFDRISRKWMRETMSVIVGSLFYLCSTTLEADVELVNKQYVAKRIPKRVLRQPMSMYKVGWTTGAALTRYRAERARVAPSEQDDLAHQQDPQHRRAHFKMQPYGPGKTLRKLIFVSAYWTHVEKLGEYGLNTARPVPLVSKGEARESVRTTVGMKS